MLAPAHAACSAVPILTGVDRAAVSVVATFLAGLYAAGATAVYAAATLVASNRRLPAGGPPRRGLRYHVD